jgi:5'-methylthioadenosine phosphorylase
VASVGSLRRDVPVGTFVAPDDFVALHLGISFSDGDEGHQAPGFDPAWRRAVADRWTDHTDVPLLDGGVYWQAIGPRFETQAEIRLIADYADLVGMTIASECVLAGEIGLAYASVCVVDNLANGVGEVPLTVDEFRAGAAANRARLVGALDAVLPELSKEAGGS